MTVASEDERVARRYAQYAGDPRKQRAWSAANPGNAAIRDEVARHVEAALPPSGAILDAGCGSGWLLARLAADGIAADRLHGIDVLAQRVIAARAAVPGARIEQGDLRALPHDDGSFAAVVALTVLSSLAGPADVDAALAEAVRVTMPGGTIVLWEPRIATPGNRATRLIRVRRLERILGAPRSVASVTLFPPIARRLGRAAPWAYPLLSRVPFLRSHAFAVFRRAP